MDYVKITSTEFLSMASLGKLAKVCGCPKKFLEQIQIGLRDSIPISAAIAIGDYLGVSPDSFSEYQPPTKKTLTKHKVEKPEFTKGEWYEIEGNKLCFEDSARGYKVTHYLFRARGGWLCSYTDIEFWIGSVGAKRSARKRRFF